MVFMAVGGRDQVLVGVLNDHAHFQFLTELLQAPRRRVVTEFLPSFKVFGPIFDGLGFWGPQRPTQVHHYPVLPSFT